MVSGDKFQGCCRLVVPNWGWFCPVRAHRAMPGGIFGCHNWGIAEPEDREMSCELVMHSPMDSFLSLVTLRLQPKCGFNSMSTCCYSPCMMPIGKEFVFWTWKGSECSGGDRTIRDVQDAGGGGGGGTEEGGPDLGAVREVGSPVRNHRSESWAVLKEQSKFTQQSDVWHSQQRNSQCTCLEVRCRAH